MYHCTQILVTVTLHVGQGEKAEVYRNHRYHWVYDAIVDLWYNAMLCSHCKKLKENRLHALKRKNEQCSA